MELDKLTDGFRRQLIMRLTTVALAVVGVLVIWYQFKLLGYEEWGDESETIVVAKMLAAGMPLYSKVFNHHGPLTFLTGYILERFGSFGVMGHRIPIAVMQWLAILSIYHSPVLKDSPGKNIFTAIAITAMVALLPDASLFGHTYIYQVIAGIFIVVIISQYVLPAISGVEQISDSGLALGSLLIASLPFLAVTYLPAAGLLFLCALRPGKLGKVLGYTILGLLLNLAFLGYIGSFKGYLAYHIYLNSQILPLYTDGLGIGKMIKNMLSLLSVTNTIESFISFFGLFFVFSGLVIKEHARFPWRSMLLMIAILVLLIRGFTYHGATFWYAYIGLAALVLSQQTLVDKQNMTWLCLLVLCMSRLAYPLMVDSDYFREKQRSDATRFGNLAKAITAKDDRVVAYTFQNFEYLAAERLPVSGHFFYLPWQEKYNENPKFGIYTSACDDIKQFKPKLMLIDKWLVWGKFSWDSYAKCVQRIVDNDYTQIPGEPIYVRNDYYDQAMRYLMQARPKSDTR